jgi:hypothetical protein
LRRPGNTNVNIACSLYFRESHADLVSRIDERLDWTGTALLFAPRRADTFQAFVNTVRLLQPHWQIEACLIMIGSPENNGLSRAADPRMTSANAHLAGH